MTTCSCQNLVILEHDALNTQVFQSEKYVKIVESTEFLYIQEALYLTSSLFYLLNQAHPAENDPKDPTQPNRFNAVIEKIERLYMVVNVVLHLIPCSPWMMF
jgi:hypothetical protein